MSKCAIIINNAVKRWNRPWQYGCNRPNALPSGRAFFVYRYGGDSSKNDQAYISIQHEYILAFVKSKAVNTGEWYEPKEGIEEIVSAFEGFHKQYDYFLLGTL